MTLAASLRFMRHESRGSRGRLVFFVGCLAVGVAAVVAVAGMSAGLDRGIRSEARQLLAADLSIEGRRPLPPSVDEVLSGFGGLERADVREMATIVAAPGDDGTPGRSLLVELKAVDPGYPFYGRLALDPDRPIGELLDPEGTVVAPELLTRLGLRAGDRLRIGGTDFTIRGTVASEPDRISISFTLGPRVFLSLGGLARARLEEFGSRVEHRLLIRLPEGTAAATAGADRIAERLRAALPDDGSFEVQTWSEAQPALRTGLQRAGRFLGLVALLSLLVGGIGVAQTVRSWLAGRLDAIATLRCLGMRPGEVILIYLGQTALLGLAGSGAGALAGTCLLLLAPWLLSGLLPTAGFQPFQPLAILRGLTLGVGIAVLFCLPPLASIRRVPPMRVLRRDAEPLPATPLVTAAAVIALLAGIFGTAWLQSGSMKQGALFTAGIAAASGVLALASLALTRGMGHLPSRSTRVWVRHGLVSVSRPGSGTFGAIVALGLGVLVVIGMYLVQSGLSAELKADLPTEAPTAFLIDIQPQQWEGVRETLESAGATRVESVPVVNARLTAVDGKSVEEILAGSKDDGHRRWTLTREQNLTWMKELPKGNVITEGALWSEPDRGEISIESDFARDLGARLGSTLTFSVQGVPVDLVVTSLRTVDWKTFGVNFFMIVEPGVLDEAPQTRVATARLPAGKEQAIQDAIVARFPNVTLLRIREILDKVIAILDRIGLGIRILGGFTVLAGIAILGGAISSASIRRGREVALLKTLGMTRRGVVAVFSFEYALIGLVAGAVGVAGGHLLAWSVLTRGMELPWVFRTGPFVAALAGTVALSVGAGLAASLPALSRRPIEVLRTE